MTALPLPTNSASTHLGSSRPPPSRRGLLPDWHTVPSYRSLVISALAGGVGASIGRISMQEGINRAFGPTSSYGATPKPAKCTCDMDEVVEDAILFAQAAALKNPSSASTSAIANTASISNAPTPVHPTRTNVTTNATLNLSNATPGVNEEAILGWNKLVYTAIDMGISASIGRIARQEILNRYLGPKESWGSNIQTVGICDCQALVKQNVTAKDYQQPTLTSYIW
ncbi:hypothetical protein FRB94_007964 [Tulasnella sp. JGI-2019a]|nr:hypothetical protein FRB94_007964 [Tulasnella sp. JGI-2019a]